MTLLIVYFLLALLVSFFCSVAEAVLLSVRPSFVTALERRHAPGAKALRALKDNLDRPLAAILSLNTVAHTVGAVGVGAQASEVFGNGYVGLTSGVMTLVILVFSEIIPKTLGATYWHKLAAFMAPLILNLTRALFPLVWMSEKITRLLASDDVSAYTFSRAELEAMAEIGVEEGRLERKELKVVRNLMRFHGLSSRTIMTPRTVMFAVHDQTSVAEFFKQYPDPSFSRIPVYGKDRDDISGYILKNDLLLAQARDQFDRKLVEFMRTFLILPDFTTVSNLFDAMVREDTHIVLLVDEYGSVQGVVTLEDIVETLMGLEITDEKDTVRDMQKLAREHWEKRVASLGINPQAAENKEP